MRSGRSIGHAIWAAALAAVGYSSVAQAATFNISWDGASTGSYNVGVNWTTNTVPLNNDILNDYYNVTINRVGGAVVTGNIIQTEVLNLTIGTNAGNQLTLNDNVTFGVIGAVGGGAATVSNAGTIQLGTTSSSAAQFNFLGTTTNLSGGGTFVILGNSSLFGSGTVTSNNAFIGRGSFGQNNFAFVNNGTVTADNGTLVVDPRSSGGFDNNNLLETVGGGTLQLSGNGGGAFTNTGGTISAAGSSVLDLGIVDLVDGATIIGGTLTSNSSGRFQIRSGEGAAFTTLTNNANVQVNGGASLTLLGTITNNNAIRTVGLTGVSTLQLGSSTLTLNGTGSVVLGNPTIDGYMLSTGTLVNNHTITGRGQIGQGTMTIRNNGTIDANVTGQTLLLSTTGVTTSIFNAGILRASTGTLQLGSGTISNTGTIDILNGGVLASGSTTIAGGTLNILTGGRLLVAPAGAASTRVTGASMTNAGTILVDGSELILNTLALNNTGSIILADNAGGANSKITIDNGGITLSGNGQVILSNAERSGIIGSGTLVNVTSTIHGTGILGSLAMHLNNGGTISADVTGQPLTLRPGITGMESSGTIQAVNGATIVLTGIAGGALNNELGTILTDGINSRVLLVDNISITGGRLGGESGMFLVPPGHTPSWSNLSHSGLTSISSGATLTLNGNIINSGTILLDSQSPNAGLDTGSGTTILTGGGTVLMAQNGTASPLVFGDGTLINQNNTIRGTALMNISHVVNAGTFAADVPSRFISWNMSSANGGFFANSGTILADNSRMSLGGSAVLDNTGGDLVARNGGTLQTSILTISGGTLSTGNGGLIEVTAGSGTWTNLTNNGSAQVLSGTLTLTGNIANNGVITVVSGSVGGSVRTGAATTDLVGNGQIVLTTLGAAQSSIGGNGTLNNLGNTIRGRGVVGNSTLAVTSSGTISADVPAGSLFLQPGPGGFRNSGTLSATNQGILLFTAGTFLNAGGTISAANGSTIALLNGANISGGTLTSAGSGVMTLPLDSTATIASLTNTGNLQVGDGGTLQLTGPITNNGSINIGGLNFDTALHANNPGQNVEIALNGTGTVNMTSSALSKIDGNGTFTNNGNTIQGAGSLGGNTLAIRNVAGGVIQALNSQKLGIDAGTAGIENSAILRGASGILELKGDSGQVGIINTNGIISAGDGGLVQLFDIEVSGGTLQTTGAGAIAVGPTPGNSVTFADVTNLGSLSAGPANRMTFIGNCVNNGSIGISTSASASTLTINSATAFTNNGQVSLHGSPFLICNGAGTINNAGSFGGNGTIKRSDLFANSGTLASSGGTLLLSGGFGFEVVNTGVMQVNNVSKMDLQCDLDSTNGFIHVLDSGLLVNELNAHTGSILLNGIFNNQSSAFMGAVSGTGTFHNDNTGLSVLVPPTECDSMRVSTVEIESGRLTTRPNDGPSGTNRVTTLAINLTPQPFSATGSWDLTNNDLIVDYTTVSPLATIKQYITSGFNGGNWNGPGLISSLAATSPNAGEQGKTALGYGEASVLHITDFSGFAIDDTTVLVKYTYAGDSNLDGRVDVTDLGALATNWQSSALWTGGDFNYDGVVDVTDLGMLATNWQAGTSSTAAAQRFDQALAAVGLGGTAVPEPTLAAIASALLLCRRARGGGRST